MLTVATGAFLGGILLATTGANFLDFGDMIGSKANANASTIVDTAPNVITPSAGMISLEESFTEVSELVGPTVVQIRSEKVQTLESQANPFAGSPFEGTPFEQFFERNDGNTVPREYRSNALGSGVIISQDGYIVTNNHVVENAENLEVKLFDGEYYDAEIVGRDPNSDLAVIKIDVTGLNSLQYGDPDQVRVGQWALAFGSPLSEDLDNTVTAGIVSAVQRSGRSLSQVNLWPSFIQTDAAINPGNSGGALVNLRGELIGINSAILSRTGGNQGIGFAIPVDIVKNVTSQLINDGEVKRGFLGITFGPVSPSLAKAYDVSRNAAQVAEVTAGQAADKAGIKPGDLITKIDGEPLNDYNALAGSIANRLPGDKIEVTLVREGKQLSKSVTLGLRPSDDELAGRVGNRSNGSATSSKELSGLGLTLADVDEATLKSLRAEDLDIRGVIVTQIEEGSDAYRDAELRRGDIITEIDKKAVSDHKSFNRIYGSIESGDTFIVRVHRITNGIDQSFITALVKP